MTDEADVRNGTILVICTGNVCRSPYIERVLTSRLASTGIVVSSAGTRALVGAGMEHYIAKHLARIGGDSSDFIARQVTADMLAGADLVLCASRNHRADVVRMMPRVLRRTYSVADFADLSRRLIGTKMPTRAGTDNFVRRVSEVVEAVRSEVQPRTNQDAEIIDPFRRSERVFDEMFAQVDNLLPSILAVLTGTRPEPISVTE